MTGLQAMTDLVSRAADLYRHYVPPEWNTYPNAAAAAAVGAGLVLAFWGARLLRTIYVLAFVAVGAAVGFVMGRQQNLDPLIGLTFGGGLAGIIGYLLYRWWVANTAGLVAVLVVLAVAAPRIEAVWQECQDRFSGVGTPDYNQLLAAGTQSPKELVFALADYLMKDRRDFGIRLAVALGLAWVLGLVLGLILPRFTVIVGTSVIGVLLLAAGSGVLLWRHVPSVWGPVADRPDWYLIATAVVLIAAVWRQARPARAKSPATAPAPPPSPAPPAPVAK